MKTYHSYEEIDSWLSENWYCEEWFILHVELDPLTITIGYTSEGNYAAYSERHIRSFKIIPSRVFYLSNDPEQFIHSEEISIESIEPLNVEKRVGIEIYFFAFPAFRLVADSFAIIEQEVIKTTFEPWLSDRNIFVEAPLEAVPILSFWKERFKEYGFDILFRFYGGKGMQPEELPYPDYSGYFIQLADRIKETDQGLFISSVSQKDRVVSMHFEKEDAHLNELWTVLTKILSDIPQVKLKSGNCEFSANEWKDYLRGLK